MKALRDVLSFGFEQTFTTPDWWADPGFVATSNTPLKIEKMRLLAENLAQVMSGRFIQSEDMYKHLQFETFDAQDRPSFVVTMDPGSIEVKTQPLFVKDLEKAMQPLFDAADLSGLVAYRNWWYGVKTGTEGGCHVNMAGLTPESNPFRADPTLVLKYAAFFHNNPWIHYPFMGVDVGPGGNCMRMDEHALDPHSKHAPGTADSRERFASLAARINRGEKITCEQMAEHFKGSKLAEDKHSAPSFYKFKEPLFFIEDRAVEALRSPEDFVLVAELRMRILESLQKESQVPELREFGPSLHQEMLSMPVLWLGFQEMCARLKMNAEPYRRFFERQFPKLTMGQDVPTILEVREGRRPRVITQIQMRGDLIISKTVDTSFARLELQWAGKLHCVINGRSFTPATLKQDGQELRALVLDYKKVGEATFDIVLMDEKTGQVIEKVCFSPKAMMYKNSKLQTSSQLASPSISPGRHYFNVENDSSFLV